MATLFENFALGFAALEDKVGLTKNKAARVYAEQTVQQAEDAGVLDQSAADAVQAKLTAQATDAEQNQHIVDRGLDMLTRQVTSPLKGLLSFGKLTVWIAVAVVVCVAALLYLPRKKAAP